MWKAGIPHVKGTQRVSSFSPHLSHISFSYALLGDHDENNLSYNEDTGDEFSLRCPTIYVCVDVILSFRTYLPCGGQKHLLTLFITRDGPVPL